MHTTTVYSAPHFSLCITEVDFRASVNWRTDVLYARKFGQNAQEDPAYEYTPKIKWLAYRYAEN